MKQKVNITIFLLTAIIMLTLAVTIILAYQINILSKQQTALETILSEISDENTEADKLHGKSQKDVLCENRGLIEGIVASEARGDTLEGMIAVTQTIKDRGDLWDMTYSDVVTAEGQYADPYEGYIPDNVKLAVSLVFDYGYRISDEPITHFHSLGKENEPRWAKAKACRGYLGSNTHLFYY